MAAEAAGTSEAVAKEAACELFPCPDLAMEANHGSCSDPAEEAAFRLSALSVTAEEAVCEHSVLPVQSNESKYELSTCVVSTNIL